MKLHARTHLWPSQLASTPKFIENTSQLSQKYSFAMPGLTPMNDRLQYGRMFCAYGMNRGCHSPRRMRGARSVSQCGCVAIVSCMSVNRCSGSLNTFTSTLNVACRFSGCVCARG